MTAIPKTYEESRERFHNYLAAIRTLWPAARLNSHSLSGQEDLSIDWISADAIQAKERLFILTMGEHGIEGYIGSAMLQLFVEEFLHRLDPKSTGLLFVHAINPWGMKHHQRVNANHVDLNRNFVDQDFSAMEKVNPDYDRLDSVFNPRRKLRSPLGETLRFAAGLVGKMAKHGVSPIREAALMGQYRSPRGIYYGGGELQEETRLMMDLYRSAAGGYKQLLHIDLHSGYGPRMQMSLVNSPLEPGRAGEIRTRYGVGRVAEADPQDLYSMHGDMVDWEYAVLRKEFPRLRMFATTFEFGTFGDSLLAEIRSLRSIIFRNQANQHGAGPSGGKWIDREFNEHYCPSEPAWFSKAQADTRQAFEGILKAEGYLG